MIIDDIFCFKKYNSSWSHPVPVFKLCKATRFYILKWKKKSTTYVIGNKYKKLVPMKFLYFVKYFKNLPSTRSLLLTAKAQAQQLFHEKKNKNKDVSD